MRTPQELFNLQGKTALVTGGSRGLGLQMALALGEQGARIVIAARLRLQRQSLQQRAADARAARQFSDRHAPDMTVRQQSAGADSGAARIISDRMQANGIHGVKFDGGVNLLFIDEDVESDRFCLFLQRIPVAQADAYWWRNRRQGGVRLHNPCTGALRAPRR